MFFKKDPTKKLEKQYRDKLEEAQKAQQSGKIPLFAKLTEEAEELGKQLDQLRAKAS